MNPDMANGSKIYAGLRLGPDDLRVWIMEQTATSEIIRNLPHRPLHSPEGFEWGHPGAGSSDLALAILLDHLGELGTRDDLYNGRSLAFHLHQDFKRAFVVAFRTQWNLSSDEIQKWLDRPEVVHEIAEWKRIWSEIAEAEAFWRLNP